MGGINAYERKIYSQNGEDGILEELFNRIGCGGRFFVEFGVESGVECNTRLLAAERGWSGVMIEGNPANYRRLAAFYAGQPQIRTVHSFITRDNIVPLFQEHQVPDRPDLLSIDIDGNDYWVWQALHAYKPRAVVIEYNASYPPPQLRVTPYDPAFAWDCTSYFGASLCSLAVLGVSLGYALIGSDSRGINAFFVRRDLLERCGFPELSAGQAYHPPGYGRGGHPWRDGPFLEI